LKYLVYFNNLWSKFDAIDRNHDRRLNSMEFAAGCEVIGMQLTPEEAQAAFTECDRDGAGMVLFDEFCSWCARRDGSTSPQSTPSSKKKWSEHKRRVGSASARSPKASRPSKTGNVNSSRTPRSSSASSSNKDGGRSKRGSHGPVDSQSRSPSRVPRGSKTVSSVSPRSANGVGPRWAPLVSSDSAPCSSDRKSAPGRMSEAAKASAERLSSPRRFQSPAKSGAAVVRRARTPPRGVPSHQAAALSLARSGGEIFSSSNNWEPKSSSGGFARLTKAERASGIPVRRSHNPSAPPPKA
jgi:hypothetical protein